MNSRLLKRFYAVAVLALAGVLILPFGRGAVAHSADADEGKLQGTWHITVTLHNCQTGAPLVSFPSLLTFVRGGEFVEVTSNPAFLPGQRSPGVGTWSRTEAHTFKAVSDAFLYFNSPTNPPGFQRGVQRIIQDIEVNGDQFSAKASTQFFDTNGNLLTTGCATAVGQRFPDLDAD